MDNRLMTIKFHLEEPAPSRRHNRHRRISPDPSQTENREGAGCLPSAARPPNIRFGLLHAVGLELAKRKQRPIGRTWVGNKFLLCRGYMPIHLFEGNSAEERLSAVRQLDGPDLATAALNFNLNDSKHAIIMLAAVRCINQNVAQLFKL